MGTDRSKWESKSATYSRAGLYREVERILTAQVDENRDEARRRLAKVNAASLGTSMPWRPDGLLLEVAGVLAARLAALTGGSAKAEAFSALDCAVNDPDHGLIWSS